MAKVKLKDWVGPDKQPLDFEVLAYDEDYEAVEGLGASRTASGWSVNRARKKFLDAVLARSAPGGSWTHRLSPSEVAEAFFILYWGGLAPPSGEIPFGDGSPSSSPSTKETLTL